MMLILMKEMDQSLQNSFFNKRATNDSLVPKIVLNHDVNIIARNWSISAI